MCCGFSCRLFSVVISSHVSGWCHLSQCYVGLQFSCCKLPLKRYRIVWPDLYLLSPHKKVPVITLLWYYCCIHGCKLGNVLEERVLGVLPPEKVLLVLVTIKLERFSTENSKGWKYKRNNKSFHSSNNWSLLVELLKWSTHLKMS